MTNLEVIQSAEMHELAGFLRRMQLLAVANAMIGAPIDSEKGLCQWLLEEWEDGND